MHVAHSPRSSLRAAFAFAACASGLLFAAVALLPSVVRGQGVEAREPANQETAEQTTGEVWLGVEISGDASQTDGAPVVRVIDGSPAARAGLEAGDRILEVAGAEVDDLASVREQVHPRTPGDRVELRYNREGAERTTKVVLSLRPSRRELREQQRVGELLPGSVEFQLVELEDSGSSDGGGDEPDVWTRATLRGEPVVLEFWATWCNPCRETADTLESLQETFGDRVRFVGISRESTEKLKTHFRDKKPGYTIARDLHDSAHEALFISGYPTVVVLDREGRVVEYFDGIGNERALRRQLDDLLDERAHSADDSSRTN